MVELASLKPKHNYSVFDLAQQAGFDVSDWIASSNDKRGHKANPKYCYEWSFVEPGKVAIFNLWFANLLLEDGLIKQRGNFRADAASEPLWDCRRPQLLRGRGFHEQDDEQVCA